MNSGKSWDLLIEKIGDKRVYINSKGYLHSCDFIKEPSNNIRFTNKKLIESDIYTFQNGTTMSIEEIMIRTFRKEEAKQVDGKLTIIHLDGDKHNKNLGNLKVLEFEDLPPIPHREVVLVDLKRGCNAVFKNKYYMAHELGLTIETIDRVIYKGSDDDNKLIEFFSFRECTHLWFMLKTKYHEYKIKGLFDKILNIYNARKGFYRTTDIEWYKNYVKKVMKNVS